MKTVTLEKPGRFVLSETSPPEPPGAGESLVRVRRLGICGTDLHAYRGDQPFFDYPRILGHELGVELLELGDDVTGLEIGGHYAVEPYLNCGDCGPCRDGRTNCCASLECLGVHTDGGMRELIKVPADKLHHSRTLSLDQLALVETLGIGAHAVDRSGVKPGEPTLVIGAGPIGLAVTQFVQLAGGRVAVLDIDPSRLNFCREQFGVEATILAGEDPTGPIRDALGGESPTAVFDATGNQQSMNRAFDFVASGGRLILVGLVTTEISFSDAEFHRRELTILATRNSTAADFRRIIDLVETGRIDTTPWITHRTPLESMIDQFDSWLDPASGVIKAMVELP